MVHDKLFLALLGASSAHADASRKAFAELNLTEAQPKILYILRRTDGIVQKELAGICNIRPSTLTVMLSKMENKITYVKNSVMFQEKNVHIKYTLPKKEKKKQTSWKMLLNH